MLSHFLNMKIKQQFWELLCKSEFTIYWQDLLNKRKKGALLTDLNESVNIVAKIYFKYLLIFWSHLPMIYKV